MLRHATNRRSFAQQPVAVERTSAHRFALRRKSSPAGWTYFQAVAAGAIPLQKSESKVFTP